MRPNMSLDKHPQSVPSLPPDPDPSTATGLEPGGGVVPGDTPPDSASATTGLGEPEPRPRRKMTPTGAITLAVIVLFAALFAAAAVGALLEVF